MAWTTAWKRSKHRSRWVEGVRSHVSSPRGNAYLDGNTVRGAGLRSHEENRTFLANHLRRVLPSHAQAKKKKQAAQRQRVACLLAWGLYLEFMLFCRIPCHGFPKEQAGWFAFDGHSSRSEASQVGYFAAWRIRSFARFLLCPHEC